MTTEGKRRLVRVWTIGVALLLTFTVVVFVIWRTSSGRGKWDRYLEVFKSDNAPKVLTRREEARIVAFCSDCHAMPRAETFSRDAWNDEVLKGYEFYARSGRNDLDPPPPYLAVAYFRSKAPETMIFPEPPEARTELRARFTVEDRTLDRAGTILPAISYLRWVRLGVDEDPVLLACDMRHGGIVAVDLLARTSRPRVLALSNNPCHVEPCDLDGDGLIDLVVADLGSRLPADHDHGRVAWLRRRDEGDSFEEVAVAAGLGRVADVRVADLDGDGDVDLLVAVFGAWDTGKILMLENVTVPGEQPHFSERTLDARPGTIHLPIEDLDGDGRPDFVALVSQEYEQVEAFVNRGEGRFERRLLWAAPDLTFGSSGIELVDLDRDGDTDVLYTNGDAFDNDSLKPSHGIQWLENLGGLSFAYHRLTDMPGAYRALAGDIDLDGDQDIVAVAWIPLVFRPATVSVASLASVVCLEQTEPGVFVRHTLRKGDPYYATLEMADFDGDGDLDFVAGRHVLAETLPTGRVASDELAIWWNKVLVPPAK